MIKAGTMVGSILTPIPKETLTESVIGKFYHLHIETEGISDEIGVAKTLTEQLYEKFHADVVWVEINNGVIDIQLQGSPFVWVLLLEFLPVILLGLSVVFILSSVWGIVTAIPNWAWAMLAVGGGLIFLGPMIGKSVSSVYRKSLETKEYRSYVRSRGE